MTALRKINALRKAGGEFDPVPLGWGMLLGLLSPVLMMTLVIFAFSATLALLGIDSTNFIITCFQQMLDVLVPIAKVLAGIWVAYSVAFFIIIFIATSTVRSLPSVPIVWLYVGDVLLRMHGKILSVWQNVVAFSSTLIYAFQPTDPLSTFVDDGLPPHLSTGWRAGVDPHLA